MNMPPLPWKLTKPEIRLSGRRLTVLTRGNGVAVELSTAEAAKVWAELGCRPGVVGLEINADVASAALAWDGLVVTIGSVEIRRPIRRRTWEQLEAAEKAARMETEEIAHVA